MTKLIYAPVPHNQKAFLEKAWERIAFAKSMMPLKYVTPHPIELSAHVETNPMLPDEVWIANLGEFLAAQPRPLPFRRIWIFHVGKNEVKFCYDDLTQI